MINNTNSLISSWVKVAQIREAGPHRALDPHPHSPLPTPTSFVHSSWGLGPDIDPLTPYDVRSHPHLRFHTPPCVPYFYTPPCVPFSVFDVWKLLNKITSINEWKGSENFNVTVRSRTVAKKKRKRVVTPELTLVRFCNCNYSLEMCNREPPGDTF